MKLKEKKGPTHSGLQLEASRLQAENTLVITILNNVINIRYQTFPKGNDVFHSLHSFCRPYPRK